MSVTATRVATVIFRGDAFQKFNAKAVPKGHRDSSPAFQRRGLVRQDASPEGTAETLRERVPAVLWDASWRGVLPSVETLGYSSFVPPGRLLQFSNCALNRFSIQPKQTYV
jgi:hypothetical protein